MFYSGSTTKTNKGRGYKERLHARLLGCTAYDELNRPATGRQTADCHSFLRNGVSLSHALGRTRMEVIEYAWCGVVEFTAARTQLMITTKPRDGPGGYLIGRARDLHIAIGQQIFYLAVGSEARAARAEERLVHAYGMVAVKGCIARWIPGYECCPSNLCSRIRITLTCQHRIEPDHQKRQIF